MDQIKLPSPVTKIYEAVTELEKLYSERNFTPDGHLVGSIGEIIAAEAFDLELLPMSHPEHDAIDSEGRQVQIKLTGSSRVSMYGPSDRLIVMRIVDPATAEIIYDGSGQKAWEAAGKKQRNGQSSVTLSKLQTLSADNT